MSLEMLMESVYGIQWKSSMRCLGVYVGSCSKLNLQHNWYDKIDQINTLLLRWEKRDLTLIGKIQIIKILALPKIIASLTMMHVPAGLLFDLNRLFFKFVWNKVERVARRNIIQDYSIGGLKMIDIDSLHNSLKASWLHRIQKADHEHDSWVQIPHGIFAKLGGLNIIRNFMFE